jgi:hypothetical protein
LPWANLDDQMPKHPKTIKLSDPAFRLHVSGICYCAQYLTDGLIERDAVALLVPRFKRSALDQLLAIPLWFDRGDHFEIRHYLQWNRSREAVLAERDRRSKAGKKGADQRWGTQ